MTSLRALRGLLVLVGSVALVMGLSGVALGSRGVLDGGPASANVDSELRFFAAWYAAAGLLLLRAAPRVERERAVVAAAVARRAGRA